ncbi:hypothetical protein BD410DRAFT_632307 [Rickenella mellea]|uniref:DUF6534 domain-containing protein n=1 Tax=Rickenella mellea TaxID=50990 RepID=A0A4Y7QCU4_9AGAM|nr:hypothetical protein BD410DRAFT_632307 [Rickenella mellea]
MIAPTLGNTMGALFIGLLVSVLLFGIICLQAYNYYQKYPEDRAYVKIAFLLVVNAINAALLSEGMYHYLIRNFANFAALGPYWSTNVYSFLNSFITWMCQLFFAYRVWRVSHGNYFLTGGIICLTCTHLAFGTKTAITAFKTQNPGDLNNAVLVGMTLGSALACDILITASLCFFLNTKRTGFGRTDSLINNLILYSVCTGLVTSLFAIINITVFFSMRTNLIHLGIYVLMGKLYTTSLLATLNSRDIFRGQWSRGDHNDFSTSTTKRDSNMLQSVDENSASV